MFDVITNCASCKRKKTPHAGFNVFAIFKRTKRQSGSVSLKVYRP